MICKLTSYTKEIKKKVVLNDINLELQENRIYGIIGHNGSGKTMLLRALCGLIEPSFGIREVGENINFGIILENPSFFNHLSAKENLEYLASIRNVISNNKINDILNLVGLEDDMNSKVKTFSLGMKQKLGIAQAIMEEQNVLLLDEPFNALDEKSRKEIKDLIINYQKRTHCTLVLVSHYKEEIIDIVDELLFMDSGDLRVKVV